MRVINLCLLTASLPSVHTARRSDRLVASLARGAHLFNDAGLLRWCLCAQKSLLDPKGKSLLRHFSLQPQTVTACLVDPVRLKSTQLEVSKTLPLDITLVASVHTDFVFGCFDADSSYH